MQFDGYGPTQALSIDGCNTYQFVCVEPRTSHVTVEDTVKHREEEWFPFVAKQVRKWRSWGGRVLNARFDRAGELTGKQYVTRVENELQVHVEHAPSKCGTKVCRTLR